MTTPLSWRDIPGYFDFADVYREVVAGARNDAYFVEIGVLFGKSACFMAETIRDSGKRIRFDAVDRFQWRVDSSESLMRNLDPKIRVGVSEALWAILQGQKSAHAAAEYCIRNAGLSDFINLVPVSGQERVLAYSDNSLDFVFIDAEHSFDDTATLLRAYLPKVKVGGVLAGHDFNRNFRGVMGAVSRVLGAVQTQGECFLFQKI